MGYNAGIQMYSSRKPLNPVMNVQEKQKDKKLDNKLKMVLSQLDEKTIKRLQRQGII